jgi:isoquinoline 1-oxidoreductase alpha subunit
MATFELNGTSFSFDGDGDTPLLWVIRDGAGLTGTKFGCGGGYCGSCTVHVGGVARRSCVTPVRAVHGQQVTTIEGLSSDGSHPVQRAWLEHDVAQCGYCQAGQIMAVAGLLSKNKQPSDDDIDRLHTNICRCGTYTRMRNAIHRAAELSAGEGES